VNDKLTDQFHQLNYNDVKLNNQEKIV